MVELSGVEERPADVLAERVEFDKADSTSQQDTT